MCKAKIKYKNKFVTLGKNLRQIRKNMGLSQEALAFKIDSTRNYIGCIERGEKFPSLAFLFNLADILKINIKFLFENMDY